MKPTLPLAAAIAGLSLLAACGPKGGGNQAGGAPGAPAATGPDVPITMADLPRPKAGLWQSTIDDGDGKPASTTSCYSGKQPDLGKMPQTCQTMTFKRTILGAIVIDMACANPDFSLTMHSVATGDFQSAMSSDATMSMTMKGQPPKVSKMHTEAHWVGPCPPGMKPDDAPDTTSSTG
jgi:hypothetical protein